MLPRRSKNVVFERPGALQRDLAGLICRGFIEFSAAQKLLCFSGAPWNGRHSAQHHPRIAHHAASALDNRSHGDDRMIPGEALAYLMIKSLAAWPGNRHRYLCHDLPGIENVLALVIHRRQHKELFQRNGFFTRRPRDLDLCAQRNQGRRGVRRMNDETGPSAKNGVEAAVARNRVANLAALAQAGETR